TSGFADIYPVITGSGFVNAANVEALAGLAEEGIR
ncbi:unnamed protein product, partial [marine sediment metagenome]